jgi:hypothetical protein
MTELRANWLGTFTPPLDSLLDLEASYGLRVILGIPWAQPISFLDSLRTQSEVARPLFAVLKYGSPTLLRPLSDGKAAKPLGLRLPDNMKEVRSLLSNRRDISKYELTALKFGHNERSCLCLESSC